MEPRAASSDVLTVIVPFHNEAATLRESVERVLKADLPLELEVIAVDDGSTDGSAGSVDDLVGSQRISLYTHATRQGKGAAIRTGVGKAQGRWLTIMDADLEYDAADLKRVVRPLMDGEADLVFGNRAFSGHTAYSFWYVIGNKVISLWASFLFDAWLSDVYTCMKAAATHDWRVLELREPGFGVEAEITGKFLARGFRVHEVPITYKARGREEGKKIDWRDGFGALWILLRIRLFQKGRRNAKH